MKPTSILFVLPNVGKTKSENTASAYKLLVEGVSFCMSKLRWIF